MGLLATAGAIGGFGKGLAEVGDQQAKVNLETKMQELTQAREEALTRLQGSQQKDLENQRAGHEAERTDKEIAGHSAVAHYETEQRQAEAATGRKFTGEQNTQHQASQEKIAAGHDAARVAAAQSHGAGSKAPPKEWTTKSVNLQGSIDPLTKMPLPGRTIPVQVHRDGSQWIQAGDKLYPFDGSKTDGLGIDPKSTARAPAAAVQALLANPLGTSPSGMAMKDSFVNRYHYLPQAYLSVAQSARDKATPAGGAMAPGGGTAGGADDTATAPENEDPAETEQDPQT